MIVFNYGGGRQTVAICVLIARGLLPKPDIIVMADTSRENPSTWEYLERHTKPLLESCGLVVEIASHDYATVDLYSGNGDLVLPVFTNTGKLRTYCSNEWKRRVVDRYLRERGIREGIRWIGFGFEERPRWEAIHNKVDGKWQTVCPLVDLMLNTDSCLEIIKKSELPIPHHSACWMCPHKRNSEWRFLRDNYPEYWKKAIAIDNQIREEDEQGGVFLHHDRVPLATANIDTEEPVNKVKQCTLGMCFV